MTLKENRKQLQKLRAVMAETAESLVAAADDLKISGTPLDPRLLDQCAACAFEFGELSERVSEILAEGSFAADCGDIKNLDQLEELLDGFEHRITSQQRTLQAMSIVDQAALIQSDADAGDDFQQRLNQLLDEARHSLSSADDGTKEDRANQLLEGKHVLSALVQLIADDGSLGDQEADQMADLVEREFGRKVERAVIRGRFYFVKNDETANNERPENDFREEKIKKRGGSAPAESTSSDERNSPNETGSKAKERNCDERSSANHSSVDAKRAELRRQLENSLNPGSPDASALLDTLAPEIAEHAKVNVELPVEDSDVADEGRIDSIASKDSAGDNENAAEKSSTADEDRVSDAEPDNQDRVCPETPPSDLTIAVRDVITELPVTCSNFQTFCEFHTRAADGSIQSAPWKFAPSIFIEDAREAASKRLSEGWLSHVWIMCRAIEDCGGLPPARSIDLTRLSALANGTGASSLDADEQGRIADRVRAAIDAPSAEPNLPVLLFLEAFQSESDNPLSDPDIDKLVHEVFAPDDLLGDFVEKALKLRAREAFSIELLRSRIEEAPAISLAERDKQLASECENLQEEVKRIWSAGGGKIRTTHSRQGWDEFIAIADENLTDLYLAERAVSIDSIVDKERQVRKLSEQSRKICDRREILLHDRKRFDRLVSGLQERSLKVISHLRSRKQQLQRESSREEGMWPVAELKGLMKRRTTTASWDGLLCAVLQRVFAARSESAEHQIQWNFTERDLVQFPDLISFVNSDLIDMPTVIQPEQIEFPTRVAGILLQPPRDGSVQGISSLIDELQSCGMNDLLRSIPGILNDSQKSSLKRIQSEQAKKINATLTSLRQAHRELQQLADPLALSVHSTITEAETLRDRLLDDSLDATMFLRWLESIVTASQGQIVRNVALLMQLAQNLESEESMRIVNKLDTRQFTDALYLLGKESEQKSNWQRETNWRETAKAELREPAIALSRALQSLPEPVQALLEDWFGGWQGKSKSADRPLRTKFARLIFSSTEKDKDKPSGTNEPDAFRVPCQNIIEWLSDQKLNPTFLPQLRQFQNLVVFTPLERVGSQSLVEQLRAQAAKEFGKDSRDLGVFLAPKLPQSVREDVIREFNIHGLRAGVIDDLDICRLLNVGGQKINMLLGLLEVILEQQPLNTFLPYQRHDGQHVRQEMFVGRREQAREIAETTQYSRLFSGRKLGKSALLSFVQQTYDGGSLASGNTLRVLYVSGVGASQEADFVERILDELKNQIAFTPTSTGNQSISMANMSPTECLVRTFEQFNEQRPNESVLVLFDEADLFMERQIADYEVQKEKSLSFAIRSRVEAAKDSAGLPRVRFLFSGYRVTHRSDGAWTGAWGDVLRLAPLDPEDATKLVRGPLERLGVQAADVAPTIAWRCGYQPALIIGFCRQLLQQKSLRDRIDDDAIAATFESTIVQDEVRSIVDSNFQGNPVSGIVFLAMVWTFSDHGASSGVIDLPDTLYRRLIDVHEDVSWLRAADAKSAINQIELIVQDFVRRQLIREERSATNVRTYHARFPHHIAILSRGLARDPKGTIRRQIEDYKEGSSSLSKDELASGIRSLYPFSVLSEAVEVLNNPDPSFPLRAIVFANDWPDTVPKAELSPEKGFYDTEPQSLNFLTAVSDKPLVVIDRATAETIGQIEHRSLALPPPILVGGTSLLRESIRQELDLDRICCRLSLGRIGRSSLQWWFTRMRAIEFDSDGLEQIMKVTSGIPILVQRVDNMLGDKGLRGANVDQPHLQEILEQFRRKEVPVIEKAIAEELDSREKEIIQMILQLSAEVTAGEALAEWLLNWDQLFPESGIAAVRPADTVSMRVIQELGLVPVNGTETSTIERFRSTDPGDAIHLLFHFVDQSR